MKDSPEKMIENDENTELLTITLPDGSKHKLEKGKQIIELAKQLPTAEGLPFI